MARFKDIALKATELGCEVTPVNALGARVARTNLPGIADFTALGVPVNVKMPVAIVRSLLGRRAVVHTSK